MASVKALPWTANIACLLFKFKSLAGTIIDFCWDSSLYTMLPDHFLHAYWGVGHETKYRQAIICR